MRKKRPKHYAEEVEIDWARLHPLINRALDEFFGDFSLFERAVGALILGQYVGWEVLRIVHSGSSYKKYEDVFSRGTPGFRFKDACPQRRGLLSYRSVGLEVADVVSEAWDDIRKSLSPEDRKSAYPNLMF